VASARAPRGRLCPSWQEAAGQLRVGTAGRETNNKHSSFSGETAFSLKTVPEEHETSPRGPCSRSLSVCQSVRPEAGQGADVPQRQLFLSGPFSEGTWLLCWASPPLPSLLSRGDGGAAPLPAAGSALGTEGRRRRWAGAARPGGAVGTFPVRHCARQPRCHGTGGPFRPGPARRSLRRYGNGGLSLRAARIMAAPLLRAAGCGLRGGRAFGTAGETRVGAPVPHGWAPRFPTGGRREPFGGQGGFPRRAWRGWPRPGTAHRPPRALSASIAALRINRELFRLPAALCKRAAPLGPMPNEDIDVSNLEALEKYRSFTRYFRLAEEESRKPRWWKTYRQHTRPRAGTRRRSRARALWLLKVRGSRRGASGLPPDPPRRELARCFGTGLALLQGRSLQSANASRGNGWRLSGRSGPAERRGAG